MKVNLVGLILLAALILGASKMVVAEPLGGWDTFPGPVAEEVAEEADG